VLVIQSGLGSDQRQKAWRDEDHHRPDNADDNRAEQSSSIEAGARRRHVAETDGRR